MSLNPAEAVQLLSFPAFAQLTVTLATCEDVDRGVLVRQRCPHVLRAGGVVSFLPEDVIEKPKRKDRDSL
jgi:hypothetical protein